MIDPKMLAQARLVAVARCLVAGSAGAATEAPRKPAATPAASGVAQQEGQAATLPTTSAATRTEATSASRPNGPTTTTATAAPAAQGLRVYRDPQTGRLGVPPSGVEPPGLSTAEQQMLNRSVAGLTARRLQNGARVVDLQGRFMSLAVARTDVAGEAGVACVETTAQALTALASQEGEESPSSLEPHTSTSPAVQPSTVAAAGGER